MSAPHNLAFASFLHENGRKGEGEYASKEQTGRAHRSASLSARIPCRETTSSFSCEPHSPLLSKQCGKAQAALEYHLLLALAAVALITVAAWASSLHASENNAVTGALGSFTASLRGPSPKASPASDDSLVAPALSISVFEPYEAGRPAFFKLVAVSSHATTIAPIEVAITDMYGSEVSVEPNRWDSGELAFSREFSAQFLPNASGIYTIRATCGNASIMRETIVR